MKFTAIIFAAFTASVVAKKGCGFPDGPDCKSLGQGADGLEQFVDDGCCVFPLRCGNGDGGESCEFAKSNKKVKDLRGRRIKMTA